MKIILIDDEFEKTQAIIGVLHEMGVDESAVLHRTNAREARSLMRENQFDVAIIDLQLPEILGVAPKPMAGFDFFDMILLDSNTKLPTSVLFITGKEDLRDVVQQEAELRGCQICFYRNGEEKWKVSLQNKIRYLLEQRKREKSTYPHTDIAIITAMRSELDAVLSLPYAWKPVRYAGNPVSFHYCLVKAEDGRTYSIVAAAAFTKGMPSAASLATQVSLLFQPKFLFMLGICAGIRKHTALGDVIIADPTWDWGSGKIAQDSSGNRIFLASPQQIPLKTQISQTCVDLSNDIALKKRISAGWDGEVPQGKLNIHVGPMASGASVLANSSALSDITGPNRDVIAVEMEAYAVMAAVEYAVSPAPISVTIKSVCDFADQEKGDNWQKYASYTSAAFFNQLLQSGRLQA